MTQSARTKLTPAQEQSLPKYRGKRPDFIIGPIDDPYLLRWWIIPRNRVFNIYLHKTIKDDDDRALHDHPWFNCSILLKGGLAEIYGKSEKVRRFRRFIPIFRIGSSRHRLIVPPAHSYAWTLFITGPRYREWGFYCKKGWVIWKDFVGENKGEIGRGCGEHEGENNEG